MNEQRRGGLSRARHRLRTGRHHRVKTLAAAFEQNADQVDHHIGVAHRRRDRFRVAKIGLHGVNLADPAHRLQMPGQFRPAHRDADAVATLGQRAHHVTTEKTRAAEYCDERFQPVPERHATARYMIGSALYRGPAPGLKAPTNPSINNAPDAVYLSPQSTIAPRRNDGSSGGNPSGMPRWWNAQVAELVDALVSGTSAARRGGSRPLLGPNKSHGQQKKRGP